MAPRTLPSYLLLLSSTGALAVANDIDLAIAATLPSPTAAPSDQVLQVHAITPASNSTTFLPPALLALLPPKHRAHLAFVLRSTAAAPVSPSMVEISKKKFKKTKRPSSAAIIDSADEANPEFSGGEVKIEIVLIDTEVINDGVSCVGIVSLGRVTVKGTQVVISEAGFVTALSKSCFLGTGIYPLT